VRKLPVENCQRKKRGHLVVEGDEDYCSEKVISQGGATGMGSTPIVGNKTRPRGFVQSVESRKMRGGVENKKKSEKNTELRTGRLFWEDCLPLVEATETISVGRLLRKGG